MSKILVYSKILEVPHGWDANLWQRAVAFWEERGFQFEERCGHQQIGKRGSLWGNCFSFDPMKLRTALTLTRIDLLHVEFTLTVATTTGQLITEWNQAHWRMELETLESWLLEGDKRENEWRAFNKRCLKANWNVGLWYGAHSKK